MMRSTDVQSPLPETTLDDMRWAASILLLLCTTGFSAQADPKVELANRIVDDLFSMWSEADIPVKYSFLIWPAYEELSKEANWPRLEFIRDISTVGDLCEVWPSRDALVKAVCRNLPVGVLKEYVDMKSEQEAMRPVAGTK
jgi:hypothetical protein